MIIPQNIAPNPYPNIYINCHNPVNLYIKKPIQYPTPINKEAAISYWNFRFNRIETWE